MNNVARCVVSVKGMNMNQQLKALTLILVASPCGITKKTMVIVLCDLFVVITFPASYHVCILK